MAAIRYLVDDVDRAIAFYTQRLGFKHGRLLTLAEARRLLDEAGG